MLKTKPLTTLDEVNLFFDQAAEDLSINALGARVVVQGFGNVRSWVAQLVHNNGCRVGDVGDVGDGIYNPAGLGIPAVVAYHQAEGTVAGFPSSDDITNGELLRLEWEILVPAAIDTGHRHQRRKRPVRQSALDPEGSQPPHHS